METATKIFSTYSTYDDDTHEYVLRALRNGLQTYDSQKKLLAYWLQKTPEWVEQMWIQVEDRPL